jgi:PrtD family type I secretion system ABC transporter
MVSLTASSKQNELRAAVRSCRGAVLGVALISGVVNILYLTGSFFMLEVYDRVLPSRSVPTLVALAVLVSILYTFQGIFDLLRNRILVRIGASLSESIDSRVYQAVVELPLAMRPRSRGLEPLQDLERVRSFLSGTGPSALFDLPWMPFYLGICYVFHPWIGSVAAGGAVLLIVLTALTEALSRRPIRTAAEYGTSRNRLAEASRRNAEVLRAMGFRQRLSAIWTEENAKYLASHRRASDVTGGLGSISRVLRMALQSSVLGVGAYLVVQGEATAGIMIASAILTSRALAPVELAIANWRGFLAARQSWRRLLDILQTLPPPAEMLSLPEPAECLRLEGASAAPPGEQRLVVRNVTFELTKGQALGIIGPSASGKSSLARLIVGVWEPVQGRVRLDGAALDQWQSDTLGRYIGYLPQDIELFAGSVADNIARFEKNVDADHVIAAAKAANVHEMILALPNGYETQIGEGGMVLSAGQRQRVALARALYGDPFLVVLDEPNSNLDSDGEAALTRALHGIRDRQGVAVVIAHRPSALAAVDTILVLANGQVQAIGPRDEVLAKVLRQVPRTAEPAPLKVVREAHGSQP